MAAELVGGALLSGFINVMFQRLAPKMDVIMKFFRGKADVVKLLEELKVNLRSAEALMSDAEENQLTDRYVKIWLDELTDVIYRADFLMDKIDTEVSQRERDDEFASTTSKMMNFFSRSVGAFEKAVIVEGKEILEKLCFLLDQTIHLGLNDRVPTRSMKRFGAFERSVMHKGQKILRRLDDLLGQAIYLGLTGRVPTRPLQRLHAPLVVNKSDVVGRDGDKKKIIELLLSDDASGKNLSVIPIVGLGGVGKTTLAQLVYMDSRVRKHFELKVWVTVSEDFDIFSITKAIFQEVVTSQERSIKELLVLQCKLNEALSGKRFLFVLDDVGIENYQQWDTLKMGFESGAHGSTIIVTTRSKIVASTIGNVAMHELKLVSVDDCWQIFAKYAFDDSAEATAELQQIGLEIVERCKGLPLAVKSLAGLLRSTSNPEEWRKILNSDIWQLQFQENLKNDIFPAIWLSYHFLPPALKRCFAYLSIFPKDYLFGQSDRKKIIWLWMAEGLLEPERGMKAEEVGERYLQALIRRSFFQYSSQYESTWEEPKLIMHDIVHDLARFISGEFSFEFNDSNDLSKLPTKACHLSLYSKGPSLFSKGSEVLKIMKGLTAQTRSLRTFLVRLSQSGWDFREREYLEESLLPDLFLKVGGCLRVLSLSLNVITVLPDSIGKMKYLRYLDLSGNKIKELPDSICALYNLQTLLLSFCRQLAHLPTRLGALVNLRHLDIEGTSLEEMPPQMWKMKNLQILSDFVLGENCSWRIKELGGLPFLEGSLRISGLEYIVDVKDVLEANLMDKKFLSHLILEWGGDSNITSSQQEREVLEALQPHMNLKQLTIRGYRGTIFPDWVGHESFCNMVEVQLGKCRNVCMLPPLGQLSSLRRLVIWFLDGVVSIGNEFCGSSSTTNNHPFTSLEYLDISYMPSWEEWSFSSDRLSQEGGVFPSLTELYMDGCKKLILGLPDCHLPNLKSISIEDCDEMVDVFVYQSRQEMDTNAFPSLESMSLLHCPRLECFTQKGLPLSLSCLRIVGCPVLEQRCQRGTGEDWPRIQHIPKIDIGERST